MTHGRSLGPLIPLAILAIALSACQNMPTSVGSNQFGARFVLSSGGGPLAQVTALTKRFTELNPSFSWSVENVGSDAGISLVASGRSDLGAVSRDLTATETGTVSLEPLGVVGTAVAVHPANPVKGLSLAQVRQVFSGEITNWSQVGGADQPIKVFIREPTAATRQSFDEFVFGGPKANYPAATGTVGSNAEMTQTISSFAGAIGMVTLKQTTVDDPKLQLLAVGGVPATMAALNDGRYVIRRPLYLVYPIDPAQMKPGVQRFLDFVRSPEGQKILGGF